MQESARAKIDGPQDFPIAQPGLRPVRRSATSIAGGACRCAARQGAAEHVFDGRAHFIVAEGRVAPSGRHQAALAAVAGDRVADQRLGTGGDALPPAIAMVQARCAGNAGAVAKGAGGSIDRCADDVLAFRSVQTARCRMGERDQGRIDGQRRADRLRRLALRRRRFGWRAAMRRETQAKQRSEACERGLRNGRSPVWTSGPQPRQADWILGNATLGDVDCYQPRPGAN